MMRIRMKKRVSVSPYLSVQFLDGFGRLRRLLELDEWDAGADQLPRVRTLFLQHVHVFNLRGKGWKNFMEMSSPVFWPNFINMISPYLLKPLSNLTRWYQFIYLHIRFNSFKLISSIPISFPHPVIFLEILSSLVREYHFLFLIPTLISR